MPSCPLSAGATRCTATEIVVFRDRTAGRVGPLALQVDNAGIEELTNFALTEGWKVSLKGET